MQTLLALVCCFGVLRADINRDGRVDITDLSILASEWLMEEPDMNLCVGTKYGESVDYIGAFGLYTPTEGGWTNGEGWYLYLSSVRSRYEIASVIDQADEQQVGWHSATLTGNYTKTYQALQDTYVGVQVAGLNCTGTTTPDVTGTYNHVAYCDIANTAWAPLFQHETSGYVLVWNSIGTAWALYTGLKDRSLWATQGFIDDSWHYFNKTESDATEYEGTYSELDGTGTPVFTQIKTAGFSPAMMDQFMGADDD